MTESELERIDFEEIQDMEVQSRTELEKGDEVIIDWDPYRWASKEEGYVDRCHAEVIDIHRTSGDIILELEDGRIIKDLGGNRPSVMASVSITDRSGYTDIGKNLTYYK